MKRLLLCIVCIICLLAGCTEGKQDASVPTDSSEPVQEETSEDTQDQDEESSDDDSQEESSEPEDESSGDSEEPEEDSYNEDDFVTGGNGEATFGINTTYAELAEEDTDDTLLLIVNEPDDVVMYTTPVTDEFNLAAEDHVLIVPKYEHSTIRL